MKVELWNHTSLTEGEGLDLKYSLCVGFTFVPITTQKAHRILGDLSSEGMPIRVRQVEGYLVTLLTNS